MKSLQVISEISEFSLFEDMAVLVAMTLLLAHDTKMSVLTTFESASWLIKIQACLAWLLAVANVALLHGFVLVIHIFCTKERSHILHRHLWENIRRYNPACSRTQQSYPVKASLLYLPKVAFFNINSRYLYKCLGSSPISTRALLSSYPLAWHLQKI